MFQSAFNSLAGALPATQDRIAGGADGLTRAAELSQVPLLADELLGQHHLFPEGRLDQDLQQVDLRGRNSWRLLMDEVPSVELLETQLEPHMLFNTLANLRVLVQHDTPRALEMLRAQFSELPTRQ